MDRVTYSYRAYVVGGRLTLFPEKLLERWTVPIGFFVGIGNLFISRRYVGGLGYNGSYEPNRCFNIPTIDAGVSIEIKIPGPLSIRGDIQ